MKKNIFDLQTEMINLIVKHGLYEGSYAFIYRDGKMMIVDLSQQPIKDAVDKEIQSNKRRSRQRKSI